MADPQQVMEVTGDPFAEGLLVSDEDVTTAEEQLKRLKDPEAIADQQSIIRSLKAHKTSLNNWKLYVDNLFRTEQAAKKDVEQQQSKVADTRAGEPIPPELPDTPEYSPFRGTSGQAFALASGALLAVSIVGSRLAQMDATGAMNALAAAMQGLQDGNERRFKAEMQQYQYKVRALEHRFKMDIELFRSNLRSQERSLEEKVREHNRLVSSLGMSHVHMANDFNSMQRVIASLEKSRGAAESRFLVAKKQQLTATELWLQGYRQYVKEHPGATHADYKQYLKKKETMGVQEGKGGLPGQITPGQKVDVSGVQAPKNFPASMIPRVVGAGGATVKLTTPKGDRYVRYDAATKTIVEEAAPQADTSSLPGAD